MGSTGVGWAVGTTLVPGGVWGAGCCVPGGACGGGCCVPGGRVGFTGVGFGVCAEAAPQNTNSKSASICTLVTRRSELFDIKPYSSKLNWDFTNRRTFICKQTEYAGSFATTSGGCMRFQKALQNRRLDSASRRALSCLFFQISTVPSYCLVPTAAVDVCNHQQND